ncbi:adenosylhomocysteinase [Actinoplanes sp. NBRC 101535]|uniref:adenosylhomocysteinase n=1 Tax=Actinoplanes sp. NBRC 101535 TaxID=3032196 RepID=UPI0024A080F7|nr:adenosylhomocysteinase [Actinoplanes sp. NBRC 101535]GLY02804.1 adenosylhomocysteinase [Actinoplanes sp. NBRC 101535]
MIPESMLSAYGHPGIRWAAAHMPLLHETMARDGGVFAGLRIGMCLHIEPKTAVLASLLVGHGARVRLTGSPGTTKPDVAAALTGAGVEVTAGDGAPHVDEVLALEPDLLLDNGADLTLGLLRNPPADFLGGTEETTTGGLRLREGGHSGLPFPVVVINDSPLKQLVENRFGVGQSVVQGFMNATNRMLPGADAVVVGYGPCGRGVAQTLRLLGARVAVAEVDAYRRLEALLEGHVTGDLVDLLPGADLVFLATGRTGVLGPDEIGQLRDGTVLAGVGHRGDEVDLRLLGEAGPVSGTHHRVHLLADGRRVVVLAETQMINLVAAGGNPIEAMDLGLTLQAASLAAVARGGLAPGVQPVPDTIDRDIAERFTAALTPAR